MLIGIGRSREPRCGTTSCRLAWACVDDRTANVDAMNHPVRTHFGARASCASRRAVSGNGPAQCTRSESIALHARMSTKRRKNDD
ncbi:hypothetical protein DB771_16595 [Burkholderia sp. AU29985]|nr:hypothetical protein XM57_20285 [Burkholderia cepacia]AYZ94645.1 hypothetical protein EGY28_05970 [Burkholderia dolosa]ETP63835.1 hypothetical protein BDSB_24055 [Burkholderia dolosa PC543]PRE56078.1 hypothetical protein C6P87_02965 [Burkholderia sp. AU12872]PUA75679.1 hypothetical protein DB771_16595 [Burkholderia sp. AU29985]